MKPDKREAARQLRREQGLSINQICKQLSVSKSSVSLWVRDVELTETQKEELNRQHFAHRGQAAGGATNAAKFRALREQYQQEGRQRARTRPAPYRRLYALLGRRRKKPECLKYCKLRLRFIDLLS